MPQPESEEVAEADRTNTEEQGGIMYSWKDRLRDALGMDKPAGLRMFMTVIISVIIAAVIMVQVGVTQGGYSADKAKTNQDIAKVASDVARNGANIIQNTEDIGKIDEQYSGVANTVALHTSSINSTKARVTTLEVDVEAIEGELATIGSPPEAYLTGNLTAGNITIHAEASSNGTYTANVHLVYSRAFSFNGTYAGAQQYFHTGINWTTGTPYYQTVVIFNGTLWGLDEVWWNIGTFALVAHNTTPINVLFSGLATTPSYAYVEIYPVLK